MLQIVQNNTMIKDDNGFISSASGWVVVDGNKIRVSSLFHHSFNSAWKELDELKSNHAQKETKLQEILSFIDLDEMLEALNEKCGNGQPLTLREKQSIRFMVEELSKTMKGIV